jgi:hypothetical protein
MQVLIADRHRLIFVFQGFRAQGVSGAARRVEESPSCRPAGLASQS